MKVKQLKDSELTFLGQINSVAVGTNGKYIVSACKDHSIKLFDLETLQEVHHFNHVHQGKRTSNSLELRENCRGYFLCDCVS